MKSDGTGTSTQSASSVDPQTPERLAQLLQGFAQLYRRWINEKIEVELGVRHARAIGEIGYHGSMPMSDLALEMGVTPRYVTAVVDQLEQDGLARRVPHADDRRVTIVELTDSGRETFARVYAQFIGLHEELLEALDPEQQATLCDCLVKLLVGLHGGRACPPSAA